jgi:hypothetical protein
MAVLTNIPNNTSARDWRDTVNALIKRIAALEAAGVPVETPAPAFTTQPSISPTSGTAGSTVYAATPGTVSNGAVVSRAWLLNGTAISTGVTAVPASAGTLTYQETASGPGGTTTSTVQVAAVTAATVTPAPAPSFTSQPSISPNTGTAGATTFTATAGNVSNGSITARSWTINGTVISTGITAAPASSGTLTYQETATGSGGTTQSTVQQVTVATAAAAAPAFTSQPTVSPSTGTAGTTTYTATPGAVSNGTITSRAWALNGSTISTGLTASPASAGTLTYQEFATGTGGSASSSVLTRTVSAATPTLTLSPASISIASNAAAGTTVSNIANVPAGVTPSVTPNDGRLVIAGDASAGWKVVVGMSALSAGTINFSVAATGATGASGVLTVTSAAGASRAVWLDTDMEVDSDDSQAVGVLSGIAREDGWRVIGGSVSSFVPTAGPALRGLLNYHGATAAPVGVNKSTARPSSTTGLGRYSSWTSPVSDMLGQVAKTNADLPEAVGVMRARIAAETRSDGVFLVTGGASTLAAFMQSPADGISGLTGIQLLAAKFSYIAILAGRPPGNTSAEYNIQSDRDALDYVNVNSTIPIWWADTTTATFECGPPLTQDENLDPYRKALIAAKAANSGDITAAGKRVAYDPTLVLWALKGHPRLTSVETTNVINANASNTYTDGPNARGDKRIAVTFSSNTAAVNTELDRLLAVAYTPASPALTPNPGRLWTPADYPAAKKLAWYDAQDAATVTQTGGVVSAWVDKFGLRNLVQATAARQPTYSADALGTGIGGITFVDDRLDGALSGLAAGDTLTFLAITKNNGNVAHARIFSAARAATGDFEAGGVYLNHYSATVTRIGVNGTFGATTGSNPGTGIIPIGVHARAGVAELWLNGAMSNRPTIAAAPDFSATTRFSIGSNVVDNTENFNGVYAEIVMLKNATQDDIERFIGYATQRRGIASTISAFAAYKAFPPRTA